MRPAYRLFCDEEGQVLRVSLAPYERPSGGVSPMLKAVVFETIDGRWIGSAPMYYTITMEQLKHEDLERLFEQALERG